MSKKFEHGKAYRLAVNKTISFKDNVKYSVYSPKKIWQLALICKFLKGDTFIYKGKSGKYSICIGYLEVFADWCEEVK